ncbi:hypothetical protein ACE6H2_022636 [Prunus campanulata]
MLCTGWRHAAHRLPACCAQAAGMLRTGCRHAARSPWQDKFRKFLSTFLRHRWLPEASLGRNALNGSKGKATACQGEGNAWLEWLGLGHIMVTACQGNACLPWPHFLGMP